MKNKTIFINNFNNMPVLIGVRLKGTFNFCFTDGNYNLNTFGISHTKKILKALRNKNN